MLLVNAGVRFVRFSSNGKVYGVHAVDIDLRTKPRNLKYKAKLRARVNADAKKRIDSNKHIICSVRLLPAESCFSKTVIDIDNRSFTIQVLLFDNGSFVSITEGQEKIGGLTASVSTSSVPITTSIIPAKSESLFLKINLRTTIFNHNGY